MTSPTTPGEIHEQQVRAAIDMCVRDWNDSSPKETLIGIILSMLKRPSHISQEDRIRSLEQQLGIAVAEIKRMREQKAREATLIDECSKGLKDLDTALNN